MQQPPCMEGEEGDPWAAMEEATRMAEEAYEKQQRESHQQHTHDQHHLHPQPQQQQHQLPNRFANQLQAQHDQIRAGDQRNACHVYQRAPTQREPEIDPWDELDMVTREEEARTLDASKTHEAPKRNNTVSDDVRHTRNEKDSEIFRNSQGTWLSEATPLVQPSNTLFGGIGKENSPHTATAIATDEPSAPRERGNLHTQEEAATRKSVDSDAVGGLLLDEDFE